MSDADSQTGGTGDQFDKPTSGEVKKDDRSEGAPGADGGSAPEDDHDVTTDDDLPAGG